MSSQLPDGWSYSTLSSLADIDKDSLKTSTSPDYKFKYIDIASVSTGLVNLPSETITFADAPSRARRKLQRGDVLMSTVRPNLKAFAYFDTPEVNIIASTGFSVIRAKGPNDGRFIFNTILGDDVTKQIDALVVGSNYPAINSSDVNNLEVLTPPLPEQQKIAAILTSVDDVIEKTQAQIDKLKDLKSGMMQELLTKGVGIKQGDKYAPHTEFKDSPVGRIPKGWAVTKLSKLINVMESGWSPQCESTPAPNGEWCILKTTAVSWNGFNPSANKKLPNELEPRPQIQVKANDILITRAGPAERVGVISHVDFVPEKVMLSDKIIRIQTNRCISKFLSLWLSSSFVQKYLASRVSGLAMSQTNISQSILQNIFCVIPSLEEQQAITNTINSLEVRFIATEKKLNSLILMKKALMQDLLTGKVRVKVDNDSVV